MRPFHGSGNIGCNGSHIPVKGFIVEIPYLRIDLFGTHTGIVRSLGYFRQLIKFCIGRIADGRIPISQFRTGKIRFRIEQLEICTGNVTVLGSRLHHLLEGG